MIKKLYRKILILFKYLKKVGFAGAYYKFFEIVKGDINGKSNLYMQKYYMNLSIEEREEDCIDRFSEYFDYKLDLKHPITFNSKIQWLKLYDSTEQKTMLVDKYKVRDFIKKKIGDKYLIPLLGVWDSFDNINFSLLPNSFVLKANHGSAMNYIVRDKENFDKNKAKKDFDLWMQIKFGIGPNQEWQYLNVPHKIICEEYIENFAGCGGQPIIRFFALMEYLQLFKLSLIDLVIVAKAFLISIGNNYLSELHFIII